MLWLTLPQSQQTPPGPLHPPPHALQVRVWPGSAAFGTSGVQLPEELEEPWPDDELLLLDDGNVEEELDEELGLVELDEELEELTCDELLLLDGSIEDEELDEPGPVELDDDPCGDELLLLEGSNEEEELEEPCPEDELLDDIDAPFDSRKPDCRPQMSVTDYTARLPPINNQTHQKVRL